MGITSLPHVFTEVSQECLVYQRFQIFELEVVTMYAFLLDLRLLWVAPKASLDDMEKRKFLTLPGLEAQLLSHPNRSQSLYRLHYPSSFHCCVSLRIFCNADSCKLTPFNVRPKVISSWKVYLYSVKVYLLNSSFLLSFCKAHISNPSNIVFFIYIYIYIYILFTIRNVTEMTLSSL
jgi:hypothetical protein